MKTYHEDKQTKKGIIDKPVNSTKIITDFEEIDNIDKGKPWKRLDN